MYVELLAKTQQMLLDKEPEQLIIQTIQNKNEMKNTLADTRGLAYWIDWLTRKANDEIAQAAGIIPNSGALYVSVAGAGYDG